MSTYATPAVRAAAERFGIDLATVVGTGAGGRIRLDDVYALAPAEAQTERTEAKQQKRRQTSDSYMPPAPASRFNRPSIVRQRSSQFNQFRDVDIDEFALNPLFDDFKQSATDSEVRDALAFDSNVPEMFTGGPVPLFTAGGFDPQLLLRLPWIVRHHAATAEKPSVIADIFERCGAGDADAVQNAILLGDGHKGIAAYRARFDAWRDARVTQQWQEPRRVTLDVSRSAMSDAERRVLDDWKMG